MEVLNLILHDNFNFCDFLDETFISFFSTSKTIFDKRDVIKNKVYKKYKFIMDNYPNDIINLFGGWYNMISYPIIPWKDEFSQIPTYVDNIWNVNNKITLGISSDNQPFFVLRYFVNNKQHINIFFQRYPDSKNIWSSTTTAGIFSLDTQPGYFYYNTFNEITKKNILNVVNNLRVMYVHEKPILIDY